MSPDAWNEPDGLILDFVSPQPLMARGFQGLEEVLEIIESLGAELRPDSMRFAGRRLKYSRQRLRERFHEARIGPAISLSLMRSQPPEATFTLSSLEDDTGAHSSVGLWMSPLSFFGVQPQGAQHAEHIVSLVRALASRLPVSYGLGHSRTDFYLSSDPHARDSRAPNRVYEAYWLNLYGPQLVEQIGRERMLSTPAFHLEELPGGSVLWLTRPSPMDFASDEARLTQARALVHLRPDLSLESTLATLRQRSLAFVPLPMEFDPDVADILRAEVEFQGLMERRQNIERFNRYHPPPVSEWTPASQALAPDVDNVQAAIDTYERQYTEQLIALFHEQEPLVLKDTLEALPRLDFRLWHYRWPTTVSDEQREILVRALGGWLGRYLVFQLGGRWVPRKRLEETAVIIGDRAWLPFLRSRHALQGPEAPLDYSCTQFFRVAQRLA